MKRSAAIIGFIFTIVFQHHFAGATMVKQLNIDELRQKADIIVTGAIKSMSSKVIYPEKMKANGIQVTTYAMDVDESGVIKGSDVGKGFEFTLMGVPRPEEQKRITKTTTKGKSIQLSGPLSWRRPVLGVGKKYTLFLSAPTSWSTPDCPLRALIGLGQGQFGVVADSSGKQKVVNAFNNDGLFSGMPGVPSSVAKKIKSAGAEEAKPFSGEIGYDEFVGILKGLENGK